MAKRDGPITRQKAHIAALRQELVDMERRGYRLTVQIEEAEAALDRMTGKTPEKPTPLFQEIAGNG